MDKYEIFQRGSIEQLSKLLSDRIVTAVELTRWYLERIEAHNASGASLNAVRTIASSALRAAQAADLELAAGAPVGPLHGIPYLLKDNVLTADGMPASAGSLALASFVPKREATIVRRLRDAGAILLGKTNMTEFADFVSDVMPAEFSGAGGVVRNPLGGRYDRGQGSSVGSAAAVAARLACFAIGTETQNSIQTPATYSSVVGFKPSVGRVSRHGVIPLVPSQDSPGLLAICVADAARVYEVISGPDIRDTATLAVFPEDSGERVSLDTLRIGIPRKELADRVLTPHNRELFNSILDRLRQAGVQIVDPCDLPSAQELADVRSSVFRTEFKAALDAFLQDEGAPCGIGSLAGLIAWNESHPEAVPFGQSLLLAAQATRGLQDGGYQADRRRDIQLSLDLGIASATRTAKVDALLCPMTAAAKCTGKAGAPVVAIPAGLDDSQAPFGITLFALPGQDTRLLRIAACIESVAGKRRLADLQ